LYASFAKYKLGVLNLHRTKGSWLVLENGAIFTGVSPFEQYGTFTGEVVFTTGMTGYPESLTDPSYAGQILTFTYPLIGNYGVPQRDKWESAKIHAKGVIINEACYHWNHHSSTQSLLEWLQTQNIPILMGVDTRALTKLLRESGTLQGIITNEKTKKYDFKNTLQEHWVATVSTSKTINYNEDLNSDQKKIIVVDCGIKENILRSFNHLPLTLQRVPYNYDFTQESYDGIFVSNGPGDPMKCIETIAILKKALSQNKPIFGICLGAQLMALAAGAKTYKLPFGHRGQNQPCLDLTTKRCYITSQNHGYAIDEHSLTKDWKVSFKNLNDRSVEGIAHNTKPFFAVQFHPEANPGPTDTTWLFEQFYQMI
jgi:carbamoyl-phosphate synthase small subunit